MIGTPRTREVLRIVEAIKPALAGRNVEMQGAVLAELLALWLAGQTTPGDHTTREVRCISLAVHLAHVVKLTVINAKILGTNPAPPRIPTPEEVAAVDVAPVRPQ